MSVVETQRLQSAVDLIDKINVDPDVSIDYFIPGFLVTADGGKGETGGPFVQFTYASDGLEPHVQHMPLRQRYLDKEPEDLANLITFSLEQFMGEIDARQYGAQ